MISEGNAQALKVMRVRNGLKIVLNKTASPFGHSKMLGIGTT